MNKQNIWHTLLITFVILTLGAIIKELSKPEEIRTWHGRVWFVPYDFRKPTLERFKETYWNLYEKHVLVPVIFGLGWTLNFYSLFENLGLIQWIDQSEENFLMPNKRMKEILAPHK